MKAEIYWLDIGIDKISDWSKFSKDRPVIKDTDMKKASKEKIICEKNGLDII